MQKKKKKQQHIFCLYVQYTLIPLLLNHNKYPIYLFIYLFFLQFFLPCFVAKKGVVNFSQMDDDLQGQYRRKKEDFKVRHCCKECK